MTEDEKEFAALSWKIIEWKLMYYRPHMVHPTRQADYEIDDGDYDAAEVRYLALCRELGRHNSVVHKEYPGFEDIEGDGMIEVDESRHSVQLVMRKLGSKK